MQRTKFSDRLGTRSTWEYDKKEQNPFSSGNVLRFVHNCAAQALAEAANVYTYPDMDCHFM
jgi:hypothetical protein